MADTRGDGGAGAPGLIALVGQMVLELHLLLRAQLIVGLVVVAGRGLLGRALRIVRGASGGRARGYQSGGVSGEPPPASAIHLRASISHRDTPVCIGALSFASAPAVQSTFHRLDARRMSFVYAAGASDKNF